MGGKNILAELEKEDAVSKRQDNFRFKKLPEYLMRNYHGSSLLLSCLRSHFCVFTSCICRLNPAQGAARHACGTTRFKQDPRESGASFSSSALRLSSTVCVYSSAN